eukprot:CAMPEP_0171076716 /NCGR_PEP_ID=MMETSP0766_2-20121228/13595_1 /TAXON_ID=439317 /ORGANISM="Gambierdiscus australes, Strain CAWD 149" /LENGTH=224 /DNA_ID=CAMNT_0011533717 /DNA_START=41 /DNA_END=714 /DNA_ORIENTATION=+
MDVPTLSEPPALTDDELEELVTRMQSQQLGTDQRMIAAETLEGRSLTCCQAGALLRVVQLGIMQRMLAFEVFRGRLSDLPEGLPKLLEPLSGQILMDVGIELGGGCFNPAAYGIASSFSTPRCNSEPTSWSWESTEVQGAPPRRVGWVEAVERLRTHVCTGDVSDALYEDVRLVFETLGLGGAAASQTCDQSRQQLELGQLAAELTAEFAPVLSTMFTPIAANA